MPRTCIFCNSPLTGIRAKEHVIPQWLMEYLGVTDDKLYLAVAQSTDDTIVQDRKLDAANFVEGRVCESCNNGWMSSLETEAMELLKPLIEGAVNLLSISNYERTLLAKWATKTAYVISHAAPLKKVPPASHMRYMKDHAGAVPPHVEVFGQQSIWKADFNQIQRNQWRHIAAESPKYPAPPDGSYKIAFQFRCLMLPVAHWSDPNSTPMISAGIHIPLWPVDKLHVTYHEQLPPLDTKDPMAPLDRFSSTLAVCDLDAFIQALDLSTSRSHFGTRPVYCRGSGRRRNMMPGVLPIHYSLPKPSHQTHKLPPTPSIHSTSARLIRTIPTNHSY
jgi:hypothetical protein